MGIVRISFTICNLKNPDLCETVQDVIVDTGSVLTWVPQEILDKIGIQALEERDFVTITGDIARRKLGDALCRVNSRQGACGVVFGIKGDIPVLGVTALERLGLEVDPETQTLKEKKAFLAL